MTTYNTIPDDEALLAPKKQKSFKGLVAGAAMASFLLGMVAASAASPATGGSPTTATPMEVMQNKATTLNAKGGKTSSGDQYWWQEGATSWRTVSRLIAHQHDVPRRRARPPLPPSLPQH